MAFSSGWPKSAVARRHPEPADEPSIVGVLWERRGLIVLSVLACAVAGVLYYTFAPRVYSSSTVLLLDPHLGRGLGADPAQPGYVTDSSAIDTQVKLLTSQAVLKRVADSEHLEQDPDFNGETAASCHACSDRHGRLIAIANTITIKRPERTYVVEVQASASKPEKAASLANAVAHAYNEDQIAARVQAAENDSRWVRQKLADLETQVRARRKQGGVL
jgi:polysaccharide biosynthesis transport protein